jgi:chromosome segregation ATPase
VTTQYKQEVRGMSDIRQGLEERIKEALDEINKLLVEKDDTQAKLREAESRLNALRAVYDTESRRFGEYKPELMPKEKTSRRFAGMKLIEALDLLRKEQPVISKRQALQILESEGFDFRGKRPLTAIHFCWMALDRRKK